MTDERFAELVNKADDLALNLKSDCAFRHLIFMDVLRHSIDNERENQYRSGRDTTADVASEFGSAA